MHVYRQTRGGFLSIHLFIFLSFDIAKFANFTNLKTDIKVTIYREKLKAMRI